MRLVLGVDPGITNLGLAWLNLDTMEALMQTFDLATWNGERHSVGQDDYGVCVLELLRSLRPLFLSTRHVGIERLPPKIWNGASESFSGTNRNVLQVMCYLEQSIRILYPHILVVYTAPTAVRAFIGSGVGGSGASTHAESKARSWVAGTLSEPDVVLAKRVFGTAHPDSLEAAQIALYVAKHFLTEVMEEGTLRRHYDRKEVTMRVHWPAERVPVKRKRQKRA